MVKPHGLIINEQMTKGIFSITQIYMNGYLICRSSSAKVYVLYDFSDYGKH